MKASPAVAKSYAKALFDLAKEQGRIEPVGADLERLVQTVHDAPELAAFLLRPWIGGAVKRSVALDVATRAGLAPLVCNFFGLVVTQGRGAHLGAIAAAYQDIVDADAGRVRARVRTTAALGDDERRTLAARLGRAVGGKQVLLAETLDPALLGGFVAEVGSLVLDGSLDGQLARLKQRLATA